MTDASTAVERVARHLRPVLFDARVRWDTPHLKRLRQSQLDAALDEAREIVRLVEQDNATDG